MKNQQLNNFEEQANVISLDKYELIQVQGGGFAYDLAWAIRFSANRFRYGDGYAVVDFMESYRPLN